MKKTKYFILTCIICILFGICNVYAKELNPNIEAMYGYSSNCKLGDDPNENCVSVYYEMLENQFLQPGTIIKYKVNDNYTKFFYVISDDDDKITMITRDNVGSAEKFFVSDSNATNINVRISYHINNYTNINKIKLEDSEYFGRAITVEEVSSLIQTHDIDVLDWLRAKNGTSCYWSMSLSIEQHPYAITDELTYVPVADEEYECAKRAVVEINKWNIDNTPSDGSGETIIEPDDNSDDSASSNKVQTVEVEDTLKFAYIGYIVGFILIVLGVIIFIKVSKKNKKEDID